jgi:hypothetical protein
MSENMKQLSYVSKPYEMVGSFSIFPLNEDGVNQYLKNKIVENRIIKRYGTMNIFEKSEPEDSNEKELNNAKGIDGFNKTKFNSVNKEKTYSNWNQEFKDLKKKFNDDYEQIDEKLKNIKKENLDSKINKTQSKNFRCNENNFDMIKNPNNMLKTSMNFTKPLEIDNKSNFLNLYSRNKLLKNENKLKPIDAFCPNKVPRINTGNEKFKMQYSFAKYLNEKYHGDVDCRKLRSASSSIPSKVLNDWINEEDKKFKSFLPENSFGGNFIENIKLPPTFNKLVQPEVAYSSNIKGDCKMMGDKYNPYNYYIDYSRQRKKRNVYGSVYLN